MLNQQLLQKFKLSLQKEKEKIIEELNTIANPDPKIKDEWHAKFPQFQTYPADSHIDQEEMQDEVEEYATNLGIKDRLEKRLLKVEGALERIKNGTYGKCLKCGKDLSLKRLTADPAAEEHVDEKENP